MSSLRGIIAATVGGAVAVGFLVLFFADMLQQMPWPLSERYIGFPLGAVLGSVAGAILATKENIRKSGIELFSQTHGNRFQESMPKRHIVEGIERAAIFSHWHSADNVVQGDSQGLSFTMFDLTRQIHSRSRENSSSTTYPKQTVIVIDSLEEKNGSVNLQRKLWFRKISETLLPALKGETISAGSDDDRFAQTTIDAFSKKYTVTSSGEINWLNVAVLQALSNSRGWSVERMGTKAVFYMQRKLLKAADLSTALHEIKQLLAQLETDDPKSAVHLTASGDTASFSASGILKLFVGAAVGLFGSFAVFIPIFFSLAEDYPFIVFLWPVFGLACMASCVFVASRIGSD